MAEAERQPPWEPSSFPFETNYNDHFETPWVAYQDIKFLIDLIIQKPHPNDTTTIYDPYYCNGRSGELLKRLGRNFHVIHEKVDFYKAIQEQSVPEFHILVTNPPFSDEHKQRCLQFAFQELLDQDRCFCILLPAYVASKQYYKTLLAKYGKESVVYLVPRPRQEYQYDHPEGTGHLTSPFRSAWFCGIGRERCKKAQEIWKSSSLQLPRLFLSVEDLEREGIITTETRRNPKQRRKRKRQQQLLETTETIIDNPAIPSKSNKNSKYRDEDGRRATKRF